MEVYPSNHCDVTPGIEAAHLIVEVWREPLDVFVKGQKDDAASFVRGAEKISDVITHYSKAGLHANELAIKCNVALGDRAKGQSACVCDFLRCWPGFLYAFDRMNGKHRARMP